jgi:hypothetical protein
MVIVGLLVSSQGIAQDDCSAELAEIDRRIATGNYADYNVQMARTMQQGLAQMCSMMDASTRASMMEGIEDLLPTKTEEERQAERRARSAELKVEREARKATEAAEAQARRERVSPVVSAAATGRRIAATLLNRGEVMYHTWTWDWDLHNGNLRVLYSSYPDRVQFALPDWSLNVYVAEMTPTGEVTHRHVASRQSSDHTALALRRGHDELLFERGPQERGGPSFLERWSISERRLLSSVNMEDFALAAGGEDWGGPIYQVATSDGNLLYLATQGGEHNNPQGRLAWFKLSPEGRVLGSDTYRIADSVSPWAWVHSSNGGGGIVVNVMPLNGTQLATGLRLPDDRDDFATMTASVSREKRLVVVDDQGKLAAQPIVIERDIFEMAESGHTAPQSLAEMQAAISGQFDWMEALRKDFDANRNVEYMDVGPRRVEMIRETPSGYAALSRVVAERGHEPPIHGVYLVEFDHSGETKRIYLQPLADDLEVDIRAFAPAPGGGYYLYAFEHGLPDTHVVLIDGDGNPQKRSQLPTQGITIEGIEADAKGVWLYGQAYIGKEPARLYLERVDFEQDE